MPTLRKRQSGAAKLSVYRAKRDFKKTAEPSGAKAKAKAGSHLGYLIQKHDATRLHYDFRLELDGTLKSWAVTRGPSIDPADKRLAVHVEDHPLDYGSFQGTIPKGQYGGGTVMLWDRGWWEPVGDPRKSYAKGRLTFILHGERLQGEWHLVRMGKRAQEKSKHENWLLIKAHDKFADEKRGDKLLEKYQTSVINNQDMATIARKGGQPLTEKSGKKSLVKPAAVKAKPKAIKKNRVTYKLPGFIAPQLATLVDEPPQDKSWIHEIKFDGYRVLAYIAGGDVKMLTRSGLDWTHKFQLIADMLQDLPIDGAIIDGEIVTMQPNGETSFYILQQALSKGEQDKLHYAAFDLLYLDGKDLRGLTLLERKRALEKILPKKHAHLHYSEHFDEPGGKVLEHACAVALEGIISKQAAAPYRSGRDITWLKSKCAQEQEVVIAGYAPQPKHPGRLAALIIGYYRGKELAFAGKVGTGFSWEEGKQLLRKMQKLRQKTPPFDDVPAAYRRGAQWVKPQVVAQVSFTEWTLDGRLRHPVYHGLREDKPAREVVAEIDRPVEEVKMAKTRVKAKTVKTKSPAKQLSPDLAGIKITHPERIIYPDLGITKLQLAEYYAAVSNWILPHVADRPISLLRCPEGVAKSCFFQRHAGEGMSPHVKTVPITLNEKREYLTIKDKQGLLALIQMGAVEIHIWGTHIKHLDKPDRLVFDLDPGEGVSWKQIKATAQRMRKGFEEIGLQSYPMASGGKGIHVVMPIVPGPDWDAVKEFARQVALQMARDEPKLYTATSRKNEREGRIFIDYLRNGKGASAVAPYSVRARASGGVAMPLEWDELGELKKPDQFTMALALKRLKALKRDPGLLRPGKLKLK